MNFESAAKIGVVGGITVLGASVASNLLGRSGWADTLVKFVAGGVSLWAATQMVGSVG